MICLLVLSLSLSLVTHHLSIHPRSFPLTFLIYTHHYLHVTTGPRTQQDTSSKPEDISSVSSPLFILMFSGLVYLAGLQFFLSVS